LLPTIVDSLTNTIKYDYASFYFRFRYRAKDVREARAEEEPEQADGELIQS